MGICGHILGDRKLRALNRWAEGHNFDRAFKYHRYGAAREIIDGRCYHYDVDYLLKEITPDDAVGRHWSSCPPSTRMGPRPAFYFEDHDCDICGYAKTYRVFAGVKTLIRDCRCPIDDTTTSDKSSE